MLNASLLALALAFAATYAVQNTPDGVYSIQSEQSRVQGNKTLTILIKYFISYSGLVYKGKQGPTLCLPTAFVYC